MKPINLLFFTLLALSSPAETLNLSGGTIIKAPIIRESPDSVVLDLGFEVLRVPTSQILSRETEAASEAPETSASSIFSQRQNLPARSVQDLVSAVAPATVQINTPTGQGSGFLISRQGYLITNNHVISGENQLSVILYETGDGELRKVTFENVELIAQSPLFDLALVKIHADRTFPFVPIADRNSLSQGELVFAVGSPLGLERTISQGIISVRSRVANSGMALIQHTSQINPGNSGGPLFNRRGEVVGVNNLKISGAGLEGIGFAIPASTLIHFIENRSAYAFDPRNPNSGFRYLAPAGSQTEEIKAPVTPN